MFRILLVLATIAFVAWCIAIISSTTPARRQLASDWRNEPRKPATILAAIATFVLLMSDPAWYVVVAVSAGWLAYLAATRDSIRSFWPVSTNNVAFEDWLVRQRQDIRKREEEVERTTAEFQDFATEERSKEARREFDSFRKDRGRTAIEN